MPRENHRGGATAEPPKLQTGPHVIVPTAVYTVPSATAALGLRRECLPREIRAGRLQARRRGGRYWILGRWLLAWIETGAAHHHWQRPVTPPDAPAE